MGCCPPLEHNTLGGLLHNHPDSHIRFKCGIGLIRPSVGKHPAHQAFSPLLGTGSCQLSGSPPHVFLLVFTEMAPAPWQVCQNLTWETSSISDKILDLVNAEKNAGLYPMNYLFMKVYKKYVTSISNQLFHGHDCFGQGQVFLELQKRSLSQGAF